MEDDFFGKTVGNAEKAENTTIDFLAQSINGIGSTVVNGVYDVTSNIITGFFDGMWYVGKSIASSARFIPSRKTKKRDNYFVMMPLGDSDDEFDELDEFGRHKTFIDSTVVGTKDDYTDAYLAAIIDSTDEDIPL